MEGATQVKLEIIVSLHVIEKRGDCRAVTATLEVFGVMADQMAPMFLVST